jgi:hypothetical protein
MQFENNDEEFALLKVDLEEAKKIEEILKQQLSEKKERCEALEEEVVKTKKEMENFKELYLQNLPIIKSSEALTTIMNKQMNPNLKTGLGYEEGSSCSQQRNKDSIKFVKFTFIDNNKYGETEEDNQPPRKSERKSTITETVEQIN